MTIEPEQLDETVAALSDDDFLALVERTRSTVEPLYPADWVPRTRPSGKAH